MVSSNDFKNGMTILYEGNLYKIMEFMHVKPGKGGAFVKTKLRDLRSGAIIDFTFNAAEKIEKAMIDKIEMQYLYDTGDALVFMDNETYEQIPLNKDQVEDALMFITENMNCTIQFYKGEAFSVEPPNFVELTITECEPGLQGDTSKAGTKPATVETGFTLQVPLFVNNGERIRIDTRTGTYMSRA